MQWSSAFKISQFLESVYVLYALEDPAAIPMTDLKVFGGITSRVP
jgi:hypothetical protein